MERFVMAALLLCGSMPLGGATIYVDNALSADLSGTYSVAGRDGSGSDGDAYVSVEDGLNAAAPGDVVYVRGGIYHERVDIRVNGEAGNRITLAKYPGEEAVLEGTEILTGWERCTGDDPHLTVQGTVNPDFASIYRVAMDTLPPQEYAGAAWVIQPYEDGEFLVPAQDPDMDNIIQNQQKYFAIEAESEGLQTYLVDSDYLMQPDDYWKGADVWVWLHNENNNIQTRRIVSSSRSGASITFDDSLTRTLTVSGGSDPDGYSIYNHPHLLDAPGEFYYTPEPDSTGRYWLYAWPRDTANLAGKMGINREFTGVRLIAGYGNYVTVEGLEIRGFCGNWVQGGGVTCNATSYHTGFHLKACHIHHNHGDGFESYRGVDDRIEECVVEWNVGAGLGIRNHHDTYVGGNTVANHEGTNVSCRTDSGLVIINNRIRGFLGTHGNGLAIYTECTALVAGNVIAVERNTPLTFNTMGDLVLCDNVLYSGDNVRIIASWSMGTGYHLAFNNLIIGANTGDACYFRTTGDKVFMNNAVDGGVLYGDGGASDVRYNAYTEKAWNQPALGATELDLEGVDETTLYRDYAGLDFRPLETSPLAGAGISMDSIITAYALADSFPMYDFYADADGNARSTDGAWSIGPFEYAASGIALRPVRDDFGVFPNPVRSLRGLNGRVRSLAGTGGAVAGVYLVQDPETGLFHKIVLTK